MQLENKFYNSFDEIPIYNFIEFMTSNDFNLLSREIIPEDQIESMTEAVNNIWNGIYDEYLQYMGISVSYQRIISQEKKIARLISKRWLNDMHHLEGIINIERKKLEDMRPKTEKEYDIYEDAASVSKYMGFDIDVRTTPAKKFFSYIKIIHKDVQD